MSLSKKLRFEIFKRDSFTCRYCSRKPPAVMLEVDHVLPVSKGGLDEPTNLLTSCFDCNRGKSDRLVDATDVPQVYSVEERQRMLEMRRERLEQVKAMEAIGVEEQKIRDEEEAILEDQVEKVLIRWSEKDGHSKPGDSEYYAPKTREVAVRKFLKRLATQDVMEALDIAFEKGFHPVYMEKYFYGICWRMIKGGFAKGRVKCT